MTTDTDLQTRFYEFRDKWLAETMILSSSTAIAANVNYQAVIALGADVVPLILEDMAQTPHHWFEALNILTGENPVPKEYAGNIRLMTKFWLQWGNEQGFIK